MCWSFISSGWPSALDLLCNCPAEQLQLLSCSCSNRPRSSWNCCFKRHWNCSEIPTWNDLQLHWKRGAIARLQLLKSFKVFLKLLLKMQTNCTGIALKSPPEMTLNCTGREGQLLGCNCSEHPKFSGIVTWKADKLHWNCSEIPVWNDPKLHWEGGATTWCNYPNHSSFFFRKLLLKMLTNCTGIALKFPSEMILNWTVIAR